MAPPGFSSTRAFAVNDLGQVVGSNGDAIIYSGGAWTDLNVAYGLTGTSTAEAIINAGQIVGYSNEGTFLISNSQASITEHFNPTGINDQGQVAGGAGDAAYLYSNGSLIDLNTALVNGDGWFLQYAYAIDNSGQIVGEGSFNGEVHAFLLTPGSGPVTPTPAPSSLLLEFTAVGMLGGSAWLRRKRPEAQPLR